MTLPRDQIEKGFVEETSAFSALVRSLDDQQLDQTVPAPEYAAVDVVRTAVAHGANRLRVSVQFRALERDPFQFTVLRVKTPDGNFEVGVERLGGKPIASIVRGRKDVDCPGLAAKVDLGGDTVTTSLPTSCLADPRWVQVGVGAVAIGAVDGQPDEGGPQQSGAEGRRKPIVGRHGDD